MGATLWHNELSNSLRHWHSLLEYWLVRILDHSLPVQLPAYIPREAAPGPLPPMGDLGGVPGSWVSQALTLTICDHWGSEPPDGNCFVSLCLSLSWSLLFYHLVLKINIWNIVNTWNQSLHLVTFSWKSVQYHGTVSLSFLDGQIHIFHTPIMRGCS